MASEAERKHYDTLVTEIAHSRDTQWQAVLPVKQPDGSYFYAGYPAIPALTRFVSGGFPDHTFPAIPAVGAYYVQPATINYFRSLYILQIGTYSQQGIMPSSIDGVPTSVVSWVNQHTDDYSIWRYSDAYRKAEELGIKTGERINVQTGVRDVIAFVVSVVGGIYMGVGAPASSSAGDAGAPAANAAVDNSTTASNAALDNTVNTVSNSTYQYVAEAGGAAGGASGAIGNSSGSDASAASSAAQNATSYISTASGGNAVSASNSVLGFVNSAANDVQSVVSDVQSYIDPILNDIKGVVDPIVNAVQEINNGIIQPVFGSAVNIYNEISALVDALKRDAGAGVQGFVTGAQDITNALTGVDAVLARGVQQLGETQASTITGPFSDVMGTQVSAPLGAIHDRLGGPESYTSSVAEGTPLIHLNEFAGLAELDKQVSAFVDSLKNAKGLFAPLLHTFADFITTSGAILGILNAERQRGEDAANAAYQLTTLAVGDAIEAQRRKIIDNASFDAEMADLGYSPSRRQAMKDLAYQVVQAGEAIAEWRRGLLDESQLADLLTRAGINPDDQSRLIKTTEVLPSIGDITNVYTRLVANGYFRFLGPGELSAPSEVVDADKGNGDSIDRIEAAWRMMWRLPDVGTAITLYFKGGLTRDELTGWLLANNVPINVHDNLIEANRPLIPYITIPSLVANGIIDDARGAQLLSLHGFDGQTVNDLLAYSKARAKSVHSTTVDQLHGLTQGVIMTLYTDGAITRADALTMLEHLGISTQAAELAVEVKDLQNQAAERKAAADLVIEQAKAGQITLDQVQPTLLQLGLSTLETEKAYTALIKQHTLKAKLPSLADLEKFWKMGYLDDLGLFNALQTIGYDAKWAAMFLGENKKAPQPVYPG